MVRTQFPFDYLSLERGQYSMSLANPLLFSDYNNPILHLGLLAFARILSPAPTEHSHAKLEHIHSNNRARRNDVELDERNLCRIDDSGNVHLDYGRGRKRQ